MTGVYHDKGVRFPVTFLTGDTESVFECVVDTVFTGDLTLPIGTIIALGLQPGYDMRSELANGDVVQTATYSGYVLWQGHRRIVRVLVGGSRSLLGIGLLLELDLHARFRENAVARLKPAGESK